MSFGAGAQEQQSQSGQGLLGAGREYFSNILPGLHRDASRIANESYADPAGLSFGNTVDQMLPVGEFGLPVGATEGARQLGRNMFAQASGARSLQGRLSPYNLEGVLGDAMRMASPTLIPQATQFALQRAAIAPALRQAAFNFGVSPFEMAQRALAGSGASAGSGSGFMFNAGLYPK